MNIKQATHFSARLMAVWLSSAMLFAIILLGCSAEAQDGKGSSEVDFFGVSLSNATRAQLRDALKKQNVQSIREDEKYWFDNYKAAGVLDEADQLFIGYVSNGQKFARLEYIFPSSFDTEQVQRIIKMVSVKYGAPKSINGNYGLGNVNAVWPRGAIEIKVFRGWPSTSTTLRIQHNANDAAMRAEMVAQEEAETRATATKQGKAF